MAAECERHLSFDNAIDRINTKNYAIIFPKEINFGLSNNLIIQHEGSMLYSLLNEFIETKGKGVTIQRAELNEQRKVTWVPTVVDPFEHPAISRTDSDTIVFGAPDTYKTLYCCKNCSNTFYAISSPSEADQESIRSFELEDHIPSHLSAEVRRTGSDLSFTLIDLKAESSRMFLWNTQTGSFNVFGIDIAFNNGLQHPNELAVEALTTLDNGQTINVMPIDSANFFTQSFPDILPDLPKFASEGNPEMQKSLRNIEACFDTPKPKSLLDLVLAVSLANRFQGYPQPFFEEAMSQLEDKHYIFCRLMQLFFERKDLPVCFESAE